MQDAVTKLCRCVVEITTKAELEDGRSLNKGAKLNLDCTSLVHISFDAVMKLHTWSDRSNLCISAITTEKEQSEPTCSLELQLECLYWMMRELVNII